MIDRRWIDVRGLQNRGLWPIYLHGPLAFLSRYGSRASELRPFRCSLAFDDIALREHSRYIAWYILTRCLILSITYSTTLTPRRAMESSD